MKSRSPFLLPLATISLRFLAPIALSASLVAFAALLTFAAAGTLICSLGCLAATAVASGCPSRFEEVFAEGETFQPLFNPFLSGFCHVRRGSRSILGSFFPFLTLFTTRISLFGYAFPPAVPATSCSSPPTVVEMVSQVTFR